MFIGTRVVVTDTNIFVAPVEDGQLVIYSNSMGMKERTVMILPTPVDPERPEGGIEMLSLEDYPKVFKDLEKTIDDPMTESFSYGTGRRGAGLLRVRQVGSYKVSIAVTADDLLRLSRDTFTVPDDLLKIIGERYQDPQSPMGFVVCVMDPPGADGKTNFHPIAYRSPRRVDGRLFAPAYHYHGDSSTHDQDTPHWDHTIYVGHETERLDSNINDSPQERSAPELMGEVNWSKLQMRRPHHMTCTWIRGPYANKDILCTP